jgi:hypothetical protein
MYAAVTGAQAAAAAAGITGPSAGFGVHLLLLVCAFCAGVSGNLFDTAALVTNVNNFPNDRWGVLRLCSLQTSYVRIV